MTPSIEPTARPKGLPRHVIGAISVAIGFVGGVTLLLVLPQVFGVPPKLAGFIALAVWMASTWVFWTGGSSGGPPPPPPAAEGG